MGDFFEYSVDGTERIYIDDEKPDNAEYARNGCIKAGGFQLPRFVVTL
jgi:hypothetical protein